MSAPKQIRFLLYEEIPQHQEILCWLDNYSGRARQTILANALQIGLRQLLGNPLQGVGPLQGGDSSDSGFDVKPSVPQAVPDKTSAHRKESVPDFVVSQEAKPLPGANHSQGAKPLQDVKKQVGSSSPAVRTEQEKEAHQEVVRSALQQILEDD